jgi:hypothetical protein
VPDAWHVSPDEAGATFPCDRLAGPGGRRLTRGVDVEAPPEVTFRWVCQLREAPYSYDLLDNLGRRSPRTLTPGLDQLEPGQLFMVLRIVEVVPGRQVTGRATSTAQTLFGLAAGCYTVTPRGPHASRLVVRLTLARPTRWWHPVRDELLAWGDLFMMRKQLLTIKALAEQTARHGGRAPGHGDGDQLAAGRERAQGTDRCP